MKADQQSTGAQIDARCDFNQAGLDAKVKGIIKDAVESQSIKNSLCQQKFQLLHVMTLRLDNFDHVNLIPNQSKKKQNTADCN